MKFFFETMLATIMIFGKLISLFAVAGKCSNFFDVKLDLYFKSY